jgi:two-component system phosphate regulon response regulator PhoB
METTSESSYVITVLAVDVDPFVLEILSKYLTVKDIRVVATTDPESVVALAAQEKPRLIISDIAMPGIDGLTLLNRLKAEAATRDTPVILLTSSRNPADMQEGLNSGAEAYLIKPIDWEMSWPKIQAILLRA